MVVVIGQRCLAAQTLGILNLADKQQVRAHVHGVDQTATKQRCRVLGHIGHAKGSLAGLVLGKLVIVAAGAEPKVTDVEHIGSLIDYRQRKGLGRGNDTRGDVVLIHGNRDARRRRRHLHRRVDDAAGAQSIGRGAHHIQTARHRKERSFVHNDHSPNPGWNLMEVCTHKKGGAHNGPRL